MKYSTEFEVLWSVRPRRTGTDNKRAAFKAYVARLREGCTHEDILTGLKSYASFCESESMCHTPYVMMLATFVGPNCHFEQEWIPTVKLPEDDNELTNFAARQGLPQPRAGVSFYEYRRQLKEALN